MKQLTCFVVLECLLATGAIVGVHKIHASEISSTRDEDSYHMINLGEYATMDPTHPKGTHTHIEVTGYVEFERHEKDGDTHIKLTDGRSFVVAECIPELPVCPRLRKGQAVTVRGISRYDYKHGWWEIHPVIAVRTR